MSRNVFIFHGTGGNPNENWFPWLKEKFEKTGYTVFVPQFPTPEGQSVKAWRKILDGYEEYINKDTIFIGHSLGGLFLLRLLEQLPHKVKGAYFVGTPIGIRPLLNYERDSAFSGGFDFNRDELKKKADTFVVFHSDNDPYVCLENGKELAKHLGIELSFVPNAGHFNAKAGYLAFDELWEKLQSIL
ncbi:MAG: alpha/beta fold hydrolase [Patescibacteria group bacterium]